ALGDDVSPNCAANSRAVFAAPVRLANAFPMPDFRSVAAATSMSSGSGHGLLPYTARSRRQFASFVAMIDQRSLRTQKSDGAISRWAFTQVRCSGNTLAAT